jgi:2-polyprenyl-3-methyl-5-hydroxy-6-metoxy-1,4-benzoquinol methylase
MLSEYSCPICTGPTILFDHGTTTAELFFRNEADYQIAAGQKQEHLPFYRCQTCGHGFTPLPTKDTAHLIDRWYKQSPPDTAFLDEEAGRRVTARGVLHKLTRLYPQKGTLLDIGAGPGLFVSEATRSGWQASGLEVASWAVDYAQRQQPPIPVQAGTLTDAKNLPAHSFDVVTAFDVIEHLPNPADLLEIAKHLLKKDGLLVMTTPRFDSISAALTKRRWYFLFPAHIHLFTKRSLHKILSDHNFTIRLQVTHTRHFSLKYLWFRLRNYILPSKKPYTASQSRCIPINLGDEYEIYAQINT